MSNLAVRQEDLDVYTSLAAKYNEPTKPQFQKLQLLNKEGRDGFGEWYVGRKFEGRNVAAPGEKVPAIVIIDHFGQYSYYDQATNSCLCHSPYFRTFPNGVRGSKFGYECGPKCPHKEAKRCKAQRVVFAIALTGNGDKIPCQFYVKGTAFMPFLEYIQKSSQMVMNGKLVDLPTFAYVTELSAREMVNGDTVYFAPIFKFHSLIPVDKLAAFQEMADQVRAWVEQENNHKPDQDDDQGASSVTQINQTATAAPAPTTTRQDMSSMDDVPWPTTAVEPTVVGSEDDVASAINKVLGL